MATADTSTKPYIQASLDLLIELPVEEKEGIHLPIKEKVKGVELPVEEDVEGVELPVQEEIEVDYPLVFFYF